MLLQTTDSGSNNTGDLFVVTAATATLSMTGEKGSLRVDGLRPHTIWFADKPSRTGGQLDTNEFFGQEFLQNGLPNSLHCTAAAPYLWPLWHSLYTMHEVMWHQLYIPKLPPDAAASLGIMLWVFQANVIHLLILAYLLESRAMTSAWLFGTSWLCRAQAL